ncbi:two-component hybrid sensor and regulator histidine kinase [Candidatus Vecturithrix granuli]|uniref:Two-component hybrid sensor and regulator histidine kinase n=1 Tax=Vecturithrix granuli TaxID=1499967 RepID=A0A081BUV6_VECG1|nr:two-component hybrid sensor and regulator histidine kinase [Candidatus Vecturithrix granuli]
MFKLSRYFSVTSFIAFLIVTILLGQLYHRAILRELIELGEGKNVALTQAFANSQWPQFAPFIVSATQLDAESIRNHSGMTKLRQAILYYKCDTWALSRAKSMLLTA